MTSYRYGYGRVSTAEQNADLQRDALHAAGVDEGRVFIDTASGALSSRPRLDELLPLLRPGDTLVVWRLDRLGRSLAHLVRCPPTCWQNTIGLSTLLVPLCWLFLTLVGGDILVTIRRYGPAEELSMPDTSSYRGRKG